MCKQIPLSRGKYALVSDADFERVNQYKWSLDTNGYAVRKIVVHRDGEKRQRKILLHRFILDAPNGLDVDHINHDELDCRRANLRLATRSQNNANSGPVRGLYKGVSFRQTQKRWHANIRINGQRLHLGSFADATDAARAYDRIAYLAWGEFAYLNFPADLPHNLSFSHIYPTLSQLAQSRLRLALTTA